MFKAKSIMTRDVHSVRVNTPILEAMQVLLDNNISGLPVVSDDMRLVGVVSEKDMLKMLYEPNDITVAVSEVMTHDPVAFDENDSLTDICECLIDNPFRRVFILSEGKLAGLISRTDIIRFILKARGTV